MAFDGQSDGVFHELVVFDHSPCVEVEIFLASSSISSGTKVDSGGTVGDVGGVQWAGVIVDLDIYLEGEPAVLCVVELVANNDIPSAVGIGDATCCWEGVDPPTCKCHDLDDHVGEEDVGREATMYCLDLVFDCAYSSSCLASPTCSFFAEVSKATPATSRHRQLNSPSLKHTVIENLLV